jgi:predicted transposase YdaD
MILCQTTTRFWALYLTLPYGELLDGRKMPLIAVKSTKPLGTPRQKIIPFRMLDYRVRGNRRYKGKPMRQVVVYLKPTTSELAYQTSYDLERTHHEFDVVRLWEQPAALFLQYPGLLPFAALGQSESPAEMLRQATQLVEQIEEPTTQANLMAASAILAGLRLEEDVIYRIVRRDIMQESVIYRSIQEETEINAKRVIALNFLREGLSVEAVARGTGLSIASGGA